MYYRKRRRSSFWRVLFMFCLLVGTLWLMRSPDIFTKRLESLGVGGGQVLGTFFEGMVETAREQAKKVGERVKKFKTHPPTGGSKFKVEDKKILFKFAVVADSHEDEVSFPKVLERIKDENVDFLIHLGDLVNSGEIGKLRQAKDFLDEVGIPYYVIPGDHDYNWQPDHSLANFKEVFGKDQIYPLFESEPQSRGPNRRVNVSFEHKSAFFILLDNSDNSDEVDVGQMKWLKEELEKTVNNLTIKQPASPAGRFNNVFIFSSKPLFNPYFPDKVDPNGSVLLGLLAKYNVGQIFSANVHIFARYPDGQTDIGMTTVGAAGTYKNPLPQYVLVEVFEDASFDVEARPYKELEIRD